MLITYVIVSLSYYRIIVPRNVMENALAFEVKYGALSASYKYFDISVVTNIHFNSPLNAASDVSSENVIHTWMVQLVSDS